MVQEGSGERRPAVGVKSRVRWFARLALACGYVLVCAPGLALAGGGEHGELGSSRDSRRERRWRDNPRAAMAEMVKEVCRRGRSFDTAQELLEEIGRPAVAPLLDVAARSDCDSGELVETVAKIVCREQYRSEGDRVTGAFAPVRAALAGASWDRADAALDVINQVGTRPQDMPTGGGHGGTSWKCEARGPLLAASAAPLGRLAARVPAPHREPVVKAIGALGRHATPLVSQLVGLLDDDDARYEAVTALGGIGPAAAPAVPALGRLLATTDNEFRRLSIAYALREIGPSAYVALPQLRARIVESAASVCTPGPGALPWYLRAAFRIGAPPGASAAAWNVDIAADVRKALATLRRCDAADSEGQLLDLLAEMAPALGVGPIVEVMLDEGRSIARRTRAAVALRAAHGVVPPLTSATQKLLLDRLHSGGSWYVGNQEQGGGALSRTAVAWQQLTMAMARCDREAGRPSPKQTPFSDASDRNDEMAVCLGRRLCGPDPERRARAMAICCRYAYGHDMPAGCKPSAGRAPRARACWRPSCWRSCSRRRRRLPTTRRRRRMRAPNAPPRDGRSWAAVRCRQRCARTAGKTCRSSTSRSRNCGARGSPRSKRCCARPADRAMAAGWRARCCARRPRSTTPRCAPPWRDWPRW